MAIGRTGAPRQCSYTQREASRPDAVRRIFAGAPGRLVVTRGGLSLELLCQNEDQLTDLAALTSSSTAYGMDARVACEIAAPMAAPSLSRM
ncbi:hypothetical protein Lesp01_06640 [Lentzea sp. NBRC 102530]|nr:hypothetical protein Lesp01_06640 [Lentzea sp. NBRC 102530]